MKRPLICGLIILLIDQFFKLFFQLFFKDKTIMLFDNWGFTYVTNPGIWIDKDITWAGLLLIQVLAVFMVCLLFFLIKYYESKIRKSILIDLAFGFIFSAALGNVIVDKIIFGYIRDYFINPIAISNLADIGCDIAAILFLIEILTYRPSRIVFKLQSPKVFANDIKDFLRFIKEYCLKTKTWRKQ